MKQISYVMAVDWNWIKQRPQFIAEKLAEKYRLKVFYRYGYNKKVLSSNEINNSNLELIPVYTIPLIHRYRHLKWFNNKQQVYFHKKSIERFNSDFIYLSHPRQYPFLGTNTKSKIIYDCMDYHSYFCNSTEEMLKIQMQEEQLIKKADVVLVSSLKLKENLINDYSLSIEEQNKLYLVRNGYNGEIIKNKNQDEANKDKLVITYVGTVSHWFDFDTILKSLEDFENIEYKIIGPIDNVGVPQNRRIKYVGSVNHENIYKHIKNDDVLIMPFKVNEIIEAVDPVKLYEYINFSKNIISIKYKEIDRFDEFVYFYNNYNEYNAIISRLVKDRSLKYTEESRLSFLENNTWDKRVEQIYQILERFE